MEAIGLVFGLLAGATATLLVFICGFRCGMLYVKARSKEWMQDQAEAFSEMEEMHRLAINDHIAIFKHNILHEFQQAQKAHQERQMSGYYHGDEEDEEDEDFDDDPDNETDPSLS